MLVEWVVPRRAKYGFTRSSNFVANWLGSLQIFQEASLAESIEDIDCRAELGFNDGWLEFRTRIIHGDFDRRFEQLVGCLVVSMLALFVVPRLPQVCFEYRVPRSVYFWLMTGSCTDPFQMHKWDSAFRAVLFMSICGLEAQKFCKVWWIVWLTASMNTLSVCSCHRPLQP